MHLNTIRRIICLVLVFLSFSLFSQEQISLISWNIRDFGKTKNNEELDRMAEILRDADIVAIQEVVAGYGGAQAVAKLTDNLNRKGAKWDYVISNPTNSSNYVTERYAFIWKTKNIKIKNRGLLIADLDSLVDREPFYLDFYVKGIKLTVLNFHSRPHDKNPESEILAITDYLKIIGYKASINNQSTTLKQSCDGNDYLNYPIDNIFHSKNVSKIEGKAIDFVKVCENLEEARNLSDHLPVYLSFSLN